MTKEQEYLSQLEKEQKDYIHALGWLARQNDSDQRAKTAIRKAIDIVLEFNDNKIRESRKNGVDNDERTGTAYKT